MKQVCGKRFVGKYTEIALSCIAVFVGIGIANVGYSKDIQISNGKNDSTQEFSVDAETTITSIGVGSFFGGQVLISGDDINVKGDQALSLINVWSTYNAAKPNSLVMGGGSSVVNISNSGSGYVLFNFCEATILGRQIYISSTSDSSNAVLSTNASLGAATTTIGAESTERVQIKASANNQIALASGYSDASVFVRGKS